MLRSVPMLSGRTRVNGRLLASRKHVRGEKFTLGRRVESVVSG